MIIDKSVKDLFCQVAHNMIDHKRYLHHRTSYFFGLLALQSQYIATIVMNFYSFAESKEVSALVIFDIKRYLKFLKRFIEIS